MYWRGSCIVPQYKGRVTNVNVATLEVLVFLSAVGKLFGRVLIKRIRAGTECAIGEEQCGFRMHGPSVCCKAGV